MPISSSTSSSGSLAAGLAGALSCFPPVAGAEAVGAGGEAAVAAAFLN